MYVRHSHGVAAYVCKGGRTAPPACPPAFDRTTDGWTYTYTPYMMNQQAVKPKAAGLALGQSVGNFFFKRGEVG